MSNLFIKMGLPLSIAGAISLSPSIAYAAAPQSTVTVKLSNNGDNNLTYQESENAGGLPFDPPTEIGAGGEGSWSFYASYDSMHSVTYKVEGLDATVKVETHRKPDHHPDEPPYTSCRTEGNIQCTVMNNQTSTPTVTVS